MDRLEVYIIPSFHYDLAYLRTFEEYLPRVKYIFLRVLNLAKECSNYTFLFEQAFLLELARYLIPEHVDFLRELIASGRIEVASPYIQTDNNIVLGESFLRNVLIGKEVVESFGGKVNVLWLGDVFGNNAQIPQIATICGLRYVQFSRGLNEDPPKVFIWEALGSSRVLSYYGDYGGLVPKELEKFRKLVTQLSKTLGNRVLLMSGGDYAIPDRELPKVVEGLNKHLRDIEVRLSTPSVFFHDLENTKLIARKGDMNPTLTGTYGSRILIKQGVRRIEYKLLSAEAISTIATLLGWSYPSEELESCWKKLFMVQFHDVIAGSCVDSVYIWGLNTLKDLENRLDSLISYALDYIASKINTNVSGKPLLIFNPLPYYRRDIVKVRINFVRRDVTGVRVFDGEREIPCQLIDKEFYDGEPPSYLPENISLNIAKGSQKAHNVRGLRSAVLIFVAEVPPLGYKVFNVVEDSSNYHETDIKASNFTIENYFFKITLGKDGTIKNLIDKLTGENFVSREKPFFNNIILQIDRGDFYNMLPLPNPKDPYPEGLVGIYRKYKKGCELSFGELALARRFHQIGDDKLWGYVESRHGIKNVELIESGPVRATLKVCGEIRFWTTIKLRYIQYIYLYSKIPRIDFETIIEHHGKYYRLRVCFPTNIESGRIRHEIPFGWVERGEGEYPALNWIDYSNENKGLCLLNRGLPGNNVVDGIMFLTLMRSTSFEYKGESWRGFMDGEINKYEYALVPHTKESNWFYPHLLGAEYNMPLLAKFVSKSSGKLPREFSFLSVEPKEVMISAVYIKEGSLIIRLYEAMGRDNTVKICFFKRPTRVEEIRADGSLVKVLDIRGDGHIRLKIKPFEIKTLRVTLENSN